MCVDGFLRDLEGECEGLEAVTDADLLALVKLGLRERGHALVEADIVEAELRFTGGGFQEVHIIC